jgi:hypothetical protein
MHQQSSLHQIYHLLPLHAAAFEDTPHPIDQVLRTNCFAKWAPLFVDLLEVTICCHATLKVWKLRTDRNYLATREMHCALLCCQCGSWKWRGAKRRSAALQLRADSVSIFSDLLEVVGQKKFTIFNLNLCVFMCIVVIVMKSKFVHYLSSKLYTSSILTETAASHHNA